MVRSLTAVFSILVMASVWSATQALAQPCEPDWAALGGGTLVNGMGTQVNALALFDDDGDGSASVYAGGTFTTAGGENVNRIAKWTGTHWQPLTAWNSQTNTWVRGVNGGVNAMAVWTDTNGPALFVTGVFTTAGGLAVNRIARWKDGAWSELSGPSGTGLGSGATGGRALAVFDDGTGSALYVAGEFGSAGGVAQTQYVAKWNGEQWSSAGVTLNGFATSLAEFGGRLHVGGAFTTANGFVVNGVARRNSPTAWGPLASGGNAGVTLPAYVRAMHVHNDGSGDALYVAGDFSRAGGLTANLIARWNGSVWSTLTGSGGTGITAPGSLGTGVTALASFPVEGGPDKLIVAGAFSGAGGVAVNNVAVWRGNGQWSTLEGPNGNGVNLFVYSLLNAGTPASPKLLVGGGFSQAGGVQASNIAIHTGVEWLPMLSSPPAGVAMIGVQAMSRFDAGQGERLFVGGVANPGFTVDDTRGLVANWTGSRWEPAPISVTGGFFSDGVYAMTTFDDGEGRALYVGGDFYYVNDIFAAGIFKWNGSSVESLPLGSFPGFPGTVYAMREYDFGFGPVLLTGGYLFQHPVSFLFGNIAIWDGAAWYPMPQVNGIAGVDGIVRAFEEFDDGSGPALYVAGDFLSAGGTTVNRIVKWTGDGWEGLTGPTDVGLNGNARAMEVFDDGTGQALYVGGFFTTAGGIPASRIAKWTGNAWQSVGSATGLDIEGGSVRALRTLDDGSGPSLWVGGTGLGRVGGRFVNNVVKWTGTRWKPLQGLLSSGVEDGNSGYPNSGEWNNPGVYAFDRLSLSGIERVVVGGLFDEAGGKVSFAVSTWRDCATIDECPRQWAPMGTTDGLAFTASISAMKTLDLGDGPAIYAAGGYRINGGPVVSGVAKWVGNAWQAFGPPVELGFPAGNLSDIEVYDSGAGPRLHVIATGFPSPEMTKLLRLDGGGWTIFNASADNIVRKMIRHNSGDGEKLYFYGSFTTIEGISTGNIARWNGSTWQALPVPAGRSLRDVSNSQLGVTALVSFNDGGGTKLYAGGSVLTAGPVEFTSMAVWNGSQWQDMPECNVFYGPAQVRVLQVHDDGTGPALYAGGVFENAEEGCDIFTANAELNHIAKFDGVRWTPLGVPGDYGMSQMLEAGLGLEVRAMSSIGGLPDERGLYVVGKFSHAGPVEVFDVARWDGQRWHALDGPLTVGSGSVTTPQIPLVATLTTPEGVLVAIGGNGMQSIGGVPVTRAARYGRFCNETEPCIADFNQDGELDFFDVVMFLNALSVGDPSADLNGDLQFDFFDFLEFLTLYDAGCDD